MNREIKRGQIYWADLSPVVGSEQGGKRPVVVIQNNVGNKYSPTVIIAIITSRQNKSKLPTHYWIKSNILSRPSMVELEQIRTVDKKRLSNYQGMLSTEEIQELDKCLMVSVGLI